MALARDHAVVLGAGIAGLLAARILHETFTRVTVVERDPLPSGPQTRRGIPQGRHVHTFQARGVQIAGEIFPGLPEELAAAGASVVADLADVHFGVDGHLLNKGPKPITPLMLATRPFLENSIRQRVAGLGAVALRDRLEVVELLHSGRPGETVVHGVRVAPAGGGAVEDIVADLVVDTTGKSSRTPAWLSGFGYQRPVEERIAVRVTYASQVLRLPDGALVPPFVVEGRSPQLALGVTFLACEQRSWVFSVAGASRAFPAEPTAEWMRQVAAECLPADLLAVLEAAGPISPVAVQQHPASIRRRYDLLDTFPAGLMVMGDALCSFNPVAGQGMSVVFEQALALRAAMHAALRLEVRPEVRPARRPRTASGGEVARAFFAAAAEPTLNAWQLAAGPDLAEADTPVSLDLWTRLMGRYVGRVFRIAEGDAEVARRFMAVTGLVAPSTSLLRPRVLWPVLRSVPGSLRRVLGRRHRHRSGDQESPSLPSNPRSSSAI